VPKLFDVNVDRQKQIKRDEYYMNLAEAVECGADCLGSRVGAVLVLRNRVISTGYNGTPQGFLNCSENGCVRCYDSWLSKEGRENEMSDPEHVSGRALDRCICVHAEQNALITAARFGIAVDGAVLYTTRSPCFSCLKEAVQAGVTRIVYKTWYGPRYRGALREQYLALADHLEEGIVPLGGGPVEIVEATQPDPYEEREDDTPPIQPLGWSPN
jgi:dCMP deaminase